MTTKVHATPTTESLLPKPDDLADMYKNFLNPDAPATSLDAAKSRASPPILLSSTSTSSSQSKPTITEAVTFIDIVPPTNEAQPPPPKKNGIDSVVSGKPPAILILPQIQQSPSAQTSTQQVVFVDVVQDSQPAATSRTPQGGAKPIVDSTRENAQLYKSIQNQLVVGLAHAHREKSAARAAENAMIRTESKSATEKLMAENPVVEAAKKQIADADIVSVNTMQSRTVALPNTDVDVAVGFVGKAVPARKGKFENQVVLSAAREHRVKMANQAAENQKVKKASTTNTPLSMADLVDVISHVLPGPGPGPGPGSAPANTVASTSVQETSANTRKQDIQFIDIVSDTLTRVGNSASSLFKTTEPPSKTVALALALDPSSTSSATAVAAAKPMAKEQIAFVDMVSTSNSVDVTIPSQEARAAVRSITKIPSVATPPAAKENVAFVEMVESAPKSNSRRLASSTISSKKPTRSPSHLTSAEQSAMKMVNSRSSDPGDSVKESVRNTDADTKVIKDGTTSVKDKTKSMGNEKDTAGDDDDDDDDEEEEEIDEEEELEEELEDETQEKLTSPSSSSSSSTTIKASSSKGI